MTKIKYYPYTECSKCHQGLAVCENVNAEVHEEGLLILCYRCWYRLNKVEHDEIRIRAERDILKKLIRDKLGY